MSKPKLLAVVGPTASGKSDLALTLAERLHGEIVSADSMQIYRGMDIGTAKPTREELRRIPHHMIDIADPDGEYSVGQYQRDAYHAILEISERGALPILTGGSGLYVNAITYGLDLSCRPQADPAVRRELEALVPEELYERLRQTDAQAAARIHPNNVVRVRRALEIAMHAPAASYDFNAAEPEFDVIIVGISLPREELYDRINRRVDTMMKRGLLEEVRNLYRRFGSRPNAMQAIGYKEIISYLAGEIADPAQAAERIKRNTRHFAKRQMTWFRRDGRICWVPSPVSADAVIERLWEEYRNADTSSQGISDGNFRN